MWRKKWTLAPKSGSATEFLYWQVIKFTHSSILSAFLTESKSFSVRTLEKKWRHSELFSQDKDSQNPGIPLIDLRGWLMSMGEVEGERGKEIHRIYSLCSSFQDWRNINVTSIFTIQNLDMNRRSRWNIRALNCIWWCMSVILPHWGRKMDNLRTSWSR